MFLAKEVLIVLGAWVLTVSTHRFVRSPDKIEMNIPNYSGERESGEQHMSEQAAAAYSLTHEASTPDTADHAHQQLDADREKNQETYETEKEHSIDQQQTYNKEMNETYQGDRDKAEAHHDSNKEHYMQYQNNTHYDTSPSTNMTQDLTETETPDQFQEKGTDFVENGQEQMQNHVVNGDSPSISYSKT